MRIAMRLKFWGTRGSIPSPALPGHVEKKIIDALTLAGKKNINLSDSVEVSQFVSLLGLSGTTVGGNTTCITMEIGDNLFIFDGGSGIRELGNYLMDPSSPAAKKWGFHRGRGHAYMFFTHTHWDHIQGIPFFNPMHVSGNVFDIYHIHHHVPDTLARQMEAVVFPVQFEQFGATLNFHRLKEGERIKVAGAFVTNTELKHPGKAYAFRVEADNAVAILATDAEYQSLDNVDTLKYRNFYANADVLIFDAMFSVRESFVKEDWGHSSGLIGADMASEANVKSLLLFHHDPTSTDAEIDHILSQTREYLDSQGKQLEVVVAREGLELELDNPKINSDFHISDEVINGVIFITLSGKFGGQATERFRKHLDHTLETHNSDKVVLRMNDLTELQMAGIRAMVDARRTVIRLALVGVPENVHRVIELSGTIDFFAIYKDEETALSALDSH
jgi:anti-anti-sigma factor